MNAHALRFALTFALTFALLAAPTLAGAAPAPTEAPPPGTPVGSLAAPVPLPSGLAGCWRAEGDEPGSGEQWMAAAGGSMLGQSRTVKGGRTVFFEHMRIEQRDDGGLSFTAQPKGQAGARFDAIQAGPHEWVFENRRHDFPHRVVYDLRDPQRVAARIEGLRPDGRWRVVHFPLARTACP